MKILLMIKSVYGQTFYYPACKTSALLCELIKKKTIPGKSLEIMVKLGYEPEYMPYEYPEAD